MRDPQKKIPVILLFGGMASLAMIGFTIATWKEGVSVFIGNIVFVMYLIPVGFAIAAALVEKRRQQGFIDFRAALRICFGVIVISLAVQTLFTWILVHLIDPRFGRDLVPAWLVKAENTYRRFGMPEDEIARNMAALQGTDPFSPGSMVSGLTKIYVIGFPIAVLIAVIVRRKKAVGGPS